MFLDHGDTQPGKAFHRIMRRDAGDDIGDMRFDSGKIDACRGTMDPHPRVTMGVMRCLCRRQQGL